MNKMFDFVTDTVNPIGGGPCPYDCSYCWAKALKEKFQWEKYKGEYRILEKELRRYDKGSFVFVQDMGDIGDPKIPKPIIRTIFAWMHKQPEVKFLLLTKDPLFYHKYHEWMKPHIYAGATIESDMIPLKISKAPHPNMRLINMRGLKEMMPNIHRFISIEPIMAFTPHFFEKIVEINPDFVAIGYDNYKNQLPEPELEIVNDLIELLILSGIKVYPKTLRDDNKTVIPRKLN
jgi:DNA repair photolyase